MVAWWTSSDRLIVLWSYLTEPVDHTFWRMSKQSAEKSEVDLSDEKLWLETAKKIFEDAIKDEDKARADLDKARHYLDTATSDLQEWKAKNHKEEGFSPLHPELLELKKEVKETKERGNGGRGT